MTKKTSKNIEKPFFQTPKDLDELKERWANGERFSFYFFYGHDQRGGEVDSSCLSQWFRREFEIDGVRYPTAEHWMMAEKARAFKDNEALGRILTCYSPKEAKMLGRLVRNFDQDVWERIRFDTVKRGNEAKFSQNIDLKNFLVGTANSAVHRSGTTHEMGASFGLVAEDANPYLVSNHDLVSESRETISLPFNRGSVSEQSILVEAAGRDRIWGIGLGKDNPKSKDPFTWRGLNLLGFALTIVRNEMQ